MNKKESSGEKNASWERGNERMLSEQFIGELKERNDIEEVVSSRLLNSSLFSGEDVFD